MNKKILTAITGLAAASASFGFITWYGSEGEQQVMTELGVNAEDNSGYWYDYNDGPDGKSSVTWKVPKGDEWDEGSMAPVVAACGGVCGTYTLDAGTITYDPFVGIGFNVGGADEGGAAIPVDATAMGGVCIGYSVDTKASLELGLGDEKDAAIGYANPAVTLKAAATGAVVDAAWADFAQPSWASEKISMSEATTGIASIKFKIQAKTGSTGSFNIASVGAYQGGCKAPGAVASIGAKALQSSLKAQLSGRTLSFGKTLAKAEIVNLQGQVVMAASSVSSMDLSKLQAGVYMVRAAGLSQQIMLK